jgi:hypothetical protein
MQNVEKVYMESPQGDEIKARRRDHRDAQLRSWLQGWHQVPAPAAPTANSEDTPKAATPNHAEAN